MLDTFTVYSQFFSNEHLYINIQMRMYVYVHVHHKSSVLVAKVKLEVLSL